MNSKEINEVINNLSEKLGIGVSSMAQLVPHLARAGIANGIMWAVLWIVIVNVTIFVLRPWILKYTDKYDRPVYLFGASLVTLISLAAFVACATDAIKWFLAPDAMAIQYVLNMVK